MPHISVWNDCGNVQSSIMAKTSLLSKDFGNNSVDVYGVGEIIF